MGRLYKRYLADISLLFSSSTKKAKATRILPLMTAIVVLMSISGFIKTPTESLYYVCLIINAIWLALNNGSKYNRSFILLYVILIINVSFVDIPYFFKPQMRLVLFLFMVSTTASVFDSEYAVSFREHLFKYTIFGLAVLSIGSFFAFFLGINMMKVMAMSGPMDYATNGGWFGGLTKHSMLLGPISMITSIFFFSLYLERKKKMYVALLFTCVMSAVMASSRAAVLGVVAALLYSLFMMKIAAVIRRRIIALIIVCGLATLPIYDTVFTGIINKQEERMETNDGLNSRQDKFDYRIAEFRKSPILGVGFCAVDIDGNDDYSVYDGRIEPGTSHLAVLSMTGLLGMIAYLIILYQAYINAKRVSTPHARFVLLCFIAMFVHAWFEGYVFSAGGFLAFLYWLIIGQCTDCTNLKYKVLT